MEQASMTGRESMNLKARTSTRIIAAAAALSLLGGCSIFKGGHKEKTPVLGERVPVLTTENGATVDPGIATVPVTVPPPEVNPAWPQPGGGPQKAIGDVALAAQPTRAWTAKIEGASKEARLAAAPVVADGRVYVMDTLANLHAFDARTGKPVWTKQVELSHADAPELKRPGILGSLGLKERKEYKHSLFGGGVSFDNGTVYATNGLGEVEALDAATGKTIWSVKPGGPLRGAPTIAGGSVYVMSQDNQLFALNEATGATEWSASGPLESAGIFGAASPAVGHSTVIAGYSSGDLDAYRYENGRVVWQDTLTRTSASTTVGDVTDIDADPIMDDTRVYAVGAGGRMVGYDLVTGQRLWEINISGISTPALGGDWLFVVAEDGKLYCIQRATGKVRWVTQLPHWRVPKKKKDLVMWSGPVLAGGRLVLTNSLGQLVFVTVEDGKIQSTIEASKDAINLPPVVANNRLYLLSSNGTLSAWR